MGLWQRLDGHGQFVDETLNRAKVDSNSGRKHGFYGPVHDLETISAATAGTLTGVWTRTVEAMVCAALRRPAATLRNLGSGHYSPELQTSDRHSRRGAEPRE